MKRFFAGLISTTFLFSISQALPVTDSEKPQNESVINTNQIVLSKTKSIRIQQNLIGEVINVDISGSKISIKSETGASVTVSINDKTAFRRVQPGQTSIAGAEQITINEIKVGDRVLVPGASVTASTNNEQTPVRQVIVMAREAINAQQNQERENRRARTLNGRVTAVNPERNEIMVQTRGRAANGTAEAVTVSAPGNVKFLRYAPDSLRPADAVPGTFGDLRVGDQIRIIGDRSQDGSRINAEEIVSGSINRYVGTVVEVNAARNEITVKNNQTGLTSIVSVGKKTTLRRISDDVAQTLKERANQREERRRQRADQQPSSTTPSNQQSQTQQTDRQNRREARRENRAANNNAAGQQRQANRGVPQLFENLPAITLGELKKGDALVITGTSSASDNSRMMAVSIIAGDAELQQILQRTQGGGRNANSPNSPGLPGNVGGGNRVDDNDEPRN